MNRNFSREDTQRPRSMRKDAHRQSSGTWRKAACLQDGGVIGRHPVGDSGGPDQFPAGGNATRAAALGAHLAPCAELNARPSRRGAPRACTQQTRVRTAAEAAASVLLSARPEAAPRPRRRPARRSARSDEAETFAARRKRARCAPRKRTGGRTPLPFTTSSGEAESPDGGSLRGVDCRGAQESHRGCRCAVS